MEVVITHTGFGGVEIVRDPVGQPARADWSVPVLLLTRPPAYEYLAKVVVAEITTTVRGVLKKFRSAARILHGLLLSDERSESAAARSAASCMPELGGTSLGNP